MPVELDHTIVAARDAEASARWFAEMFGVHAPEPLGHFWQVSTANGVGLDFASAAGDQPIAPQHYAFLVSEAEFDDIYGRVSDRGLAHWADPQQRHPGEINHDDGGRGVYFLSNDGHYLEILTRPAPTVPGR
jgi:catechol 2,3-dioxygenase-like lactoylglutathione lyase family enzyme